MRGTSSLPDVRNLCPLNRDTDRCAFIYAWYQCKLAHTAGNASDQALKAFFHQARSVRAPCQEKICYNVGSCLTSFWAGEFCLPKVRFYSLSTEEAAEHKKWALSQDTSEDYEYMTLQGWRQVKAMGFLQQSLRQWGHDSSCEFMEKWLGSRLGFKTARLRVMIKVFQRHTAADTDQLICELDERFGCHHVLSSMLGLDLVCAKTALPKNVNLQNSLLRWCIEHRGCHKLLLCTMEQ